MSSRDLFDYMIIIHDLVEIVNKIIKKS